MCLQLFNAENQNIACISPSILASFATSGFAGLWIGWIGLWIGLWKSKK